LLDIYLLHACPLAIAIANFVTCIDGRWCVSVFLHCCKKNCWKFKS